MCNRCEVIERELFRYRRALDSTRDGLGLFLFGEVIADLEAEKVSLHPTVDSPTE